MPPQSRGPKRLGSHSHSTPNLSTIHPLEPFPPPHDLRASTEQPSSVSSTGLSDAASAEDDDVRSQSSFEREIFSPDSTSSSGSSESEAENTTAAAAAPNPNTGTCQPGTTTRPPVTHAKSAYQQQPHHQRSLYNHSSRSGSYLGTTAPSFAPPFYNRPPTPFPPSPSLTSLLRPPFSAHPSRPTTPDTSDTEATNPTAGAAGSTTTLAASALRATPVARATPKVPTYEYYGFVLYLGSSAAFLMYLLWSYLPTPFLHQLGIYYYPDRWWSLAVPGWLVVAVCWVYVALGSWNTGWLTLGVGSVECIVDEKGEVAVVDGSGRVLRKGRKGEGVSGVEEGKGGSRDSGGELDWRSLWNEGTDAVLDVPVGGVCEVLYGTGRDMDEDLT